MAIKGDITGSTGTFSGVFAGTITAGDAVFGVSADGAGNDGLYINSIIIDTEFLRSEVRNIYTLAGQDQRWGLLELPLREVG